MLPGYRLSMFVVARLGNCFLLELAICIIRVYSNRVLYCLHQELEWFWTIIAGFTREEMGRLLQFTTGCSQLPPGGFAELNPKFQITSAPTYGNLPTAHTWYVFNSIDEYVN